MMKMTTDSPMTNPNTTTNNNNNDNDIKLYLSKSTYTLDSSLVGTVTLPSTHNNNNNKNNQTQYSLIQVYVAGRCRVDSRWHTQYTQDNISKLYDCHPCHDVLPFIHDDDNNMNIGYDNNNDDDDDDNNNNSCSIEDYVVDCYFKDGKTKHSEKKIKKKKKHQTFCFWSTNVLTLWDEELGGVTVPVYDNNNNNYNDTKKKQCKGLIMDDSKWFKRGTQIAELDFNRTNMNDLQYDDDDDDEDGTDTKTKYNMNTNGYHNINGTISSETFMEEYDNQDDKKQPMNFTFKVDLPHDLPRTANASSTRYFYSVVVVTQTKSSKNTNIHSRPKVQIYQAPFTVVTSKPIMMDRIIASKQQRQQQQDQNENDISNIQSSFVSSLVQTKIRIGTIHAVAHPTPYPISLSSTFNAEPWRTSIQRVNGGWDNSNVRSIIMEEGGYKCAVLTIVGGVVMVPGENVLLHFNFTNNIDNDDMEDEVSAGDDGSSTCIVKSHHYSLPCHMVSACLQGEEHALGMDGSRTKTRSYMFDTAYANVDPDCTKSISLNLTLPLDSPISLDTNLVNIEVTCRVDMTVKIPNSDTFKFLTVQFPCQIVSSVALDQEQDDDSRLSKEIEAFIMSHRGVNETIDQCNKVICPEVLDDLSMLTIHIQQENKNNILK